MVLEEVREAFSTWRLAKRYNSEPIPDELWSRVQSLVPHHSRREICESLKINPRQFDLRCGARQTLLESDFHHAFVSVRVPEERFSTKELCEVVLQGERRQLSIHVSEDGLRKILPLLEACL